MPEITFEFPVLPELSANRIHAYQGKKCYIPHDTKVAMDAMTQVIQVANRGLVWQDRKLIWFNGLIQLQDDLVHRKDGTTYLRDSQMDSSNFITAIFNVVKKVIKIDDKHFVIDKWVHTRHNKEGKMTIRFWEGSEEDK